jgi:serine/threonine protein kinase
MRKMTIEGQIADINSIGVILYIMLTGGVPCWMFDLNEIAPKEFNLVTSERYSLPFDSTKEYSKLVL